MQDPLHLDIQMLLCRSLMIYIKNIEDETGIMWFCNVKHWNTSKFIFIFYVTITGRYDQRIFVFIFNIARANNVDWTHKRASKELLKFSYFICLFYITLGMTKWVKSSFWLTTSLHNGLLIFHTNAKLRNADDTPPAQILVF